MQRVCKEYAESMQRYTESMQRVCRVHRVCRGSIKMQTMVQRACRSREFTKGKM